MFIGRDGVDHGVGLHGQTPTQEPMFEWENFASSWNIAPDSSVAATMQASPSSVRSKRAQRVTQRQLCRARVISTGRLLSIARPERRRKHMNIRISTPALQQVFR